MMNPLNHELILDVGMGTGENITNLVKKCDCTIVGLDISKTYLCWFRNKSGKEHLTSKLDFILTDAVAPPFREKILSKILCSEVIEHLFNQRKPCFKCVYSKRRRLCSDDNNK